MPVTRKNKFIVCALIVAGSVILDQLSKVWAVKALKGRPGFAYLGNMLRLMYAENSGAFLSLGATLDPGLRTVIFVIGVFFIIGFCLVWLARSAKTWLSACALSAVISGGVGNLIDRISAGYVVDFLYLELGPLHTGVFNVADIAITGGLLVLLGEQYLAKEKE